MEKDELIKQQRREIERYQTLIRDAENGLDITSKPEMSIDDILSSLMFLLKQDDIKSFDDLVTLKVDLNKIPGNNHIFGFRTLFSKIEKEIDEGKEPALTIRLSFVDNYQNVLTEIVRKARDDSKAHGAK